MCRYVIGWLIVLSGSILVLSLWLSPSGFIPRWRQVFLAAFWTISAWLGVCLVRGKMFAFWAFLAFSAASVVVMSFVAPVALGGRLGILACGGLFTFLWYKLLKPTMAPMPDVAEPAKKRLMLITGVTVGVIVLMFFPLRLIGRALPARVSNPLQLYAYRKDFDKIKELLEADAPATRDEMAAVMYAAGEAGRSDIVALALSKGVSVDERWYKMTALHAAASAGRYETARMLLAKGADVGAEGSYNYTALHYAAEGGHKEIAELLIAKGADPNAGDTGGMTMGGTWMSFLLTPLHLAARHGHTDVAEVLLDAGAKIDAQSFQGRTAMHEAAGNAHAAVLALLLRNGGDANVHDKRGKTPLRLAASGADVPFAGCAPCVEALLPHVADVNAKDEGGWTPLHVAGSSSVAEALLEAGADPNARDSAGRTPLHAHARHADKGIVEALLNGGANAKAKDNDGWTPLDVARERGLEEIVELLSQHGRSERQQDPKEPGRQ